MKKRTEEIINRFKKSWTETEDFLDMLIETGNFESLISIRNFIKELKNKGKWKSFRLGTSMHSVMFSRSVDFGLRDDQKYIKIEAINHGREFEILFRDAKKTYREYIITDLNDIKLKKLFATLEKTLVD